FTATVWVATTLPSASIVIGRLPSCAATATTGTRGTGGPPGTAAVVPCEAAPGRRPLAAGGVVPASRVACQCFHPYQPPTASSTRAIVSGSQARRRGGNGASPPGPPGAPSGDGALGRRGASGAAGVPTPGATCARMAGDAGDGA